MFCPVPDSDSFFVGHIIWWFPLTAKIKLKKSSALRPIGFLLIIAKWHIWTSRKRSLSPNITVFQDTINMRYNTDKYIPLKIKTARKGNFTQDGNYLLVVNYHLLCHRSNNFLCFSPLKLLFFKKFLHFVFVKAKWLNMSYHRSCFA